MPALTAKYVNTTGISVQYMSYLLFVHAGKTDLYGKPEVASRPSMTCHLADNCLYHNSPILMVLTDVYRVVWNQTLVTSGYLSKQKLAANVP